MQTNLIFK